MKAAATPPNERERLSALASYRILDTPAELEFDDFTQLASQICQTPIALVSLVDAGRQWFKSKVGLDATETPRDLAFCAHAILGSGLMEVPNALEDERFHDNPLVSGAPGIRFYAGMPLTTDDGHNLGTLCVIDRTPRNLSPQQRDALARLGRQVVRQMELRIASDRLRQFKHALDGMPDAVFMFWPDTLGFFYVNTAACTLVGQAQAELLGMRAYELTPKYPEAKFRQLIAPLVNGSKSTLRFLTAFRHKDGRDVQSEVVLQYVADAGKTPRILAHFIATASDIAAREAELQSLMPYVIASEEKINRLQKDLLDVRTALDAHAILAITDANGVITEVNDRFCAISGYTRAELLGQTHRLINSGQHPKAFFEGMWKTISRGKVWHGDINNRAKDGSLYWVNTTIYPIMDETGKPERFVAVRTDITDRKAAEEKLSEQSTFQRTLLTGAGAAIIATDLNGLITHFNPAAEELLGYRADEMVGKLTPSVFHDPAEVVARAAELSAELGRTIEPGFEVFVAKTHGGEPETREWTYLRKDGGRVPVLLTVSALRNDAGEITGYLGVAHDITQRKAGEAALKKLTVQLSQRLAERETLLQEVHHRVKNNLQVITSLLAMQQRRATSAEVAAEFQASRDRIAAIALVHEQLYGSHELDRVDLAKFIRQLGANIIQGSNAGSRVVFEVKGGTFSLDLQMAVPCALLVNELVTNALKHAFPGDRPGKIEVELRVDPGGPRHIFVRDDGVGMPPELAKGRHTSLGMRLVNRLVDQLDAKIDLLAQTPGTQYHLLLQGEKKL